MVESDKKILCLLLIGFLFSTFIFNFGSCDESNSSVPFSYDELGAEIRVTSPIKNFTYSDSTIVINASLYVDGTEYEPGKHYIPYENISCVYSLDDSDWQNMSLFSVNNGEITSDLVNNYFYNYMLLNYTAILHNVTEGSHCLRIDVHPNNIRSRDSSSGYDKPLVYFYVKNQLITESTIILLGGLVIAATAILGSAIYIIKKKSSNKILRKN